MRWKIILQLLLLVVVIGIASNFINMAVMSYYFNASSDNITASAKLVKFDPNDLNVKQFVSQIRVENNMPYIDKEAARKLNQSKSWVQIIDSNGNVVKSVNGPNNVSNSYSTGELEKIKENPDMMKGYNVFILNGPVATASVTIKGPGIPQGKGPVFAESRYQYVIGVPKPKITVFTLLYSFFNYLTAWNRQKLVSTLLTLFFALLLGYFYASRITRPVGKITKGITQIAEGKYDVSYPESGLYKEVYGSLNKTAGTLRQNETERVRMEKMREEWIMNISHDLKTPLSSIQGYGEMLLDYETELSDDEIRKYAGVIMNKSQYMRVLLEDFKLTQKLKNGLIPLKMEETNIVELIREVIINILNDPKYQQRKVIFEPAEDIISIRADQMLIQRTLSNIIFNALVHNPEDTVVWVRVWKDSAVSMEIEDNGRGISEEDQKNLFDRYYRGTNTDESYSGSGLGLAIARQVIEAHKGRIELSSKIGEGTKIRIIL